ncbi:hypothetical protein [Streptomyces sp. NPDC020951]|uniref:hypothetical protein n=1 Tax=Streptomyces sp. NPDC020951 TaxID=3365104 RepID=UPI0037B250E8
MEVEIYATVDVCTGFRSSEGGESRLYVRLRFSREGDSDGCLRVVRDADGVRSDSGSGSTVADEVIEDAGRVCGYLLRGIFDNLFKGEDASDAYVLRIGAKSFQGFGETIGNLPSASKSVGAGGVKQGDASAKGCYNGDNRSAQTRGKSG